MAPPPPPPPPPGPPVGLLLAVVALCLLRPLLAWLLRRRLRPDVVAFFHPHADGGGGGERVLWCAVRAVQAARPAASVVLLCAGAGDAASLAAGAERLFGVPPLRPVAVVRLRWAALVEPSTYPALTLLGQATGSVLLGAEALLLRLPYTPGLFVDTAGYAFAYPLASLLGARVACYTHYPWVSSDMRAAVAGDHRGGGGSGQGRFNNRSAVARSALLTRLKLAYYACLGAAYGAAGRAADASVANSSWTARHVEAVWGRAPTVVYPPVDVAALAALPLARPPGGPLTVLSVAQYRPEKDHGLMLRAWARLLARARGRGFAGPLAPLRTARLVFAGGTRGPGDEARRAGLAAQAVRLGCGDSVACLANVPRDHMLRLLATSHVGLHAMRDEHFGIAVVEAMAAGLVPIAHNSAGQSFSQCDHRARSSPNLLTRAPTPLFRACPGHCGARRPRRAPAGLPVLHRGGVRGRDGGGAVRVGPRGKGGVRRAGARRGGRLLGGRVRLGLGRRAAGRAAITPSQCRAPAGTLNREKK